ncbi:sel1 repeat family protein [Streptomyces sp. MST-110588]|uniref:sel1 repeat family protein n=1 Tax=Streptomyces sp. MST-110588 TaxID=2833628 RepID=UPI001F5C92A2|nr:sel1 repeat family protein [Streptomyces sp. MST-110588]UNO43552.1 sel1 repeat family protein [Streptomyces sp. MST-110588]
MAQESQETQRKQAAHQKQAAQEIQAHGEALVAAARAGDTEAARRHTDFFVLRGHVDEGIPYWEQAAAAGDAFSHYTLARYRKVRGDRPAADALYRAVADRHAGCAYGLGVLLKENGDPEAAEWFRRGWEDGRHLDCKIELGKLLAAQGRLEEAAKFLMSDVELGDIAVFRWVKLFESIRADFDSVAAGLDAAEAAGDADAAEEALRPLFDLEQHFRDYPGLIPEAAGYYRRAAALSPSARVDQAVFLEATGTEASWPEARGLLLQAHQEGYDGAAYVLGVLHEQRGDLGDAEHWYGLAATGGHPAARWNLGLLCKRQRRLEEAERWLREVGEDDEDVVEQLARIAALRESGEAGPGKDLRRLPGLRERAEAGDVHASYAYGKILGDWAGADARHLLRWIEPAALAGDPQAAYDLAELHNTLRAPGPRDHWYRKAAEAGHHEACQQMGWLSEYHRDYQEAERWYVRAAGDGSPLHAMFAGKLKAQRGAYSEAEPYLRTAWEEGGDFEYGTEAAGYYGLVLHRLGRLTEAVEPLRTAAARWEEDVYARYGMDDLNVLARMADPEEELAAVEAALAKA